MADLFEEKAKDWDVNEMVLALSSAIGSAIKEQVELNETMQVMDFGAGTGLVTAQVAERVGKVTAVDVSQSMLDQLVAKQHLELKVDAVCQNILELPLDTRFDLIVSAMAMHHVEDTNACAALPNTSSLARGLHSLISTLRTAPFTRRMPRGSTTPVSTAVSSNQSWKTMVSRTFTS